MLSRKTFIEAIEAIQKHEKLMEELAVPLRKLGDFPLSLDFESIHRNALMKVLEETTGDTSEWISWWLYEDVEKKVWWEEDGKEVEADLTEAGALYDFLKSNVEEASADKLDLIDLEKDSNGKPRQAIEKSKFQLYFDASLKHIDKTGATLFVCEGAEPQYVVMPLEQYELFIKGEYDDMGPFTCPECFREMEVMYASDRADGDGKDVIIHCRHCHHDWQGHYDKSGVQHELERYFFG